MSSRVRTLLFLLSAAGLAALFAWGYRDLPPMGDYRGPYGNVVTQVAVYERHATDIVNAINYDYRAFDTLGEEFIFFASVLGVLLLFRSSGEQGAQKQTAAPAVDQLPISDALRVSMGATVGAMIVFGVYMATHGQLTPGGGFQGGVVLATVPLVVYLSGDARAFERIISSPLIKLAESGGAAGYALVGIGAMLCGAHFLTNVIPLGTTGDLFSSGTIAIISVAVGMEVTGGFVLLIKTYLREIIEERLQKGS